MGGDRTALLIIRAWIEDDSAEPLRAHIRMSENVSEGFQRTVTLSRVEAVSAEVERWLVDILDQRRRHPDGGSP